MRMLWRFSAAGLLSALALASMFPAHANAGEAAARAPELIRIDGDRALFPPAQLAWSPEQGFVALFTDGETHGLALYRANDQGEKWKRWRELPAKAAQGEAQLAIAGDRALVLGATGSSVWSLSVPLSQDAAAKGAIAIDTLAAGARVISVALDASPPDAEGKVFAHLAYLVRPDSVAAPGGGIALAARAESLAAAPAESSLASPPDNLPYRVIAYRRSSDAGLTWSAPETLAVGDVDRPGLFAHADSLHTIDLCFRRGERMAWRGSGNLGRGWIPEKPVKLTSAPGSRNAIARRGRQVLMLCETELHQVAISTSLNHGYNWNRAATIARKADHVRLPSLDSGGGLFWVTYSAGDTLVVVRSTAETLYPKQWNENLITVRDCCMGAPDIVALPDRAAALLLTTPEGAAIFARVRQPSPQ